MGKTDKDVFSGAHCCEKPKSLSGTTLRVNSHCVTFIHGFYSLILKQNKKS